MQKNHRLVLTAARALLSMFFRVSICWHLIGLIALLFGFAFNTGQQNLFILADTWNISTNSQVILPAKLQNRFLSIRSSFLTRPDRVRGFYQSFWGIALSIWVFMCKGGKLSYLVQLKVLPVYWQFYHWQYIGSKYIRSNQFFSTWFTRSLLSHMQRSHGHLA